MALLLPAAMAFVPYGFVLVQVQNGRCNNNKILIAVGGLVGAFALRTV
jgi:hypothetical protein